ncbi:MAG: hypothetical protein ACLFU7_06205 [Armatimonadota bacterium]
MPGQLTPRERCRRAVRFEDVDHVPLTIYERKIPQCEAERELRNDGLCIVQRGPNPYSVRRPNVLGSESHTYSEGGKRLVRTVTRTTDGELTTVNEPAGFTTWHHEKMFRGPDDYAPLLAYASNVEVVADYEPFVRMSELKGGDAIMRGAVGLEPMQLIIHHWMGVETFAIEWMERRHEVLKLYDALVEERRKTYPVLAESPCEQFNYGGNVTPEIIGEARFREYYVPNYEECCEVLQPAGKLVGCHFDANTRVIAEAIAETSLDYIEAFTPAPDTDMTLAQAREAWPGKALWINYPSSVWLRSDEEMEEVTADLLRQAAPGNGLLIGVTEDVPEGRLFPGLRAINRAIHEHGRLPVTTE